MDKSEKKQMVANYKKEQRLKFINSLPVSEGVFRNYLEFIGDCDFEDEIEDDFKYTKQFCVVNDIDQNILINWLLDNGVEDDFEALNFEDEF